MNLSRGIQQRFVGIASMAIFSIAIMSGFWLVVRPATVTAQPAVTEQSASILIYHRFGEERYPSTNIKLSQFDDHIVELTSGPYHVLPLPEIVRAFRGMESLPDRTVAITIDDAYRTIYDVAWPKLRRAGLPFTIFISTAFVDGGRSDYLTWDQLRELAAAGVTIGAHTAQHLHLPTLSNVEIAYEIDRAHSRFVAELGFKPMLFAYPYGEYGAREKAAVKAAGFEAAFGQHSGVAHSGGDHFSLPRFTMNERYGDLDRLKLVANALPFPASDITPKDPIVRAGNNPPDFGFTLPTDLANIDQLACFASNQAQAVRIERLGPSRFEIRLENVFAPPRARINCTIPAQDGRWRWLGQQFYVAE